MPNQTQEETNAHLRHDDDGFDRLREEHDQLAKQIEAIEAKPHVTEADELEEQRLKKRKLAVKDQLSGIEPHHRQATMT